MMPNGARLTIQQLEHAIQVFEQRVAAKKLEIDAYAKFRDHAPDLFIAFLSADTRYEVTRLKALEAATENLFQSKVNVGLLDLEELELTLKALKQQRSGIVVPR